jgi:hypothetical protein
MEEQSKAKEGEHAWIAREKEQRGADPGGLDDLTRRGRGPVWRRPCFPPLPCNSSCSSQPVSLSPGQQQLPPLSLLFTFYSRAAASVLIFSPRAEPRFHTPPFRLSAHSANHAPPTRTHRGNHRPGPKRSANMLLSV